MWHKGGAQRLRLDNVSNASALSNLDLYWSAQVPHYNT